MKRILLSLILAFIMIAGIIPVNVLADESSITGDQIIDKIIEHSGMNAHPRIIMSEEKFAALRSHIGGSSVTAALLEELRGEAERYVNDEEDKIPSAYVIDDEDFLLETSKRIQRRVAALALAYNIFEDNRFAVRCYAELEAACNFPDWCSYHFLDTAEMCTAFAFGYDWLYNWLSPEQKTYLRENMIEKGLNQVINDYEGNVRWHEANGGLDDPVYRSYTWYQDPKIENWKYVCTGGTNLAALAIGDEDDARTISSRVLTYGFRKAYSCVREGYSSVDGTNLEGLGYWDYATYYLGLQSSALMSAAGTDYGLTDHDGILRSADFVRYMSSNVPTSFSFGDDREERNTGWAVFLWLGDRYDSPGLSAIRLRYITSDPDFNYLDVLWIDESKQTGNDINRETDWGSVGSSNASFRDSWDRSGIVAALHAGENDLMYHGHCDLGSFYIESNGSRFFTDLGNERYNLPNREKSYRIKAEGHNTLVINPTSDIDQRDGVNCLMTEFQSGDTAYAITDLSDAYSTSGATSVVRGLKLIKDKKCVIVQDEISLADPGEIYWFAHTKGQISVAGDGKSAIVTVGSDRLWVGLISETGRFTVMDAKPLPTSMNVPGAKDNSAYRKLAVHLTDTRDATISVACIPLNSGESRPSWTPSLSTLSEWSGASGTVDMGLGEHLYGCDLSLAGDIGVNFYMDLSSADLSEDAYLEFNIPTGDDTRTERIYVNAKAGTDRTVADVVTRGGKTYYVFRCRVSPKDYASMIGAQMFDGDKAGSEYSYSVKTYAEYLLAHTGSNAEYNRAAPFVQALVRYCTWAQSYFGIDPDLIDQDLLEQDLVTSVTAQKVRADITDPVTDLRQIPGVTFEGSTLSLKSETTLSLFFRSSSTLTFSCDQGGRLETERSGGYQILRIRGISAADLDKVFRVRVASGGKNGTVSYSALNYVYGLISRSAADETCRDLVRALYLYHKAAEDYAASV